MSAQSSPAVILLAPALDTGASVADAVDGGTFERRPLDARPWENRLMALLGLLDPEATASVALASVPASRLLGATDLAGAPVTVAGDMAAAAAAGRLVVADPVSLTPGRDEATLTPPEALALAPAEIDALMDAANALLAADGLAFARGASGRWYLGGLDARGLDVPPTHFLARREAGVHLPGSGEAAPWRRLMTELQMLWHTHPVNEARADRGATPVNGIWFWGGAVLPERASTGATATSPPPVVVTENDLAAALARHAGATVVSGTALDDALPGAADGDGGAGGTLAIVDTGAYAAWLADDPVALESARARILATWLAPAARAVLDGRAASLVLAGGDSGEAVFAPPPARSWFARLFDRDARR